MRNLRNTQHAVLDFPEGNLTASAFDLDDLVCTFGPSIDDPAITLKRRSASAESNVLETITSWDAPCPNPDLACDRVLDLHCFADAKIITIVFEGGDIVVVREEPGPGEDTIEIVGSVDAGIAAAKWSPDEEFLAIATKADTLLFMTRDFDGRANITLSTDDLKVSNHVDVGWGKKETQFKGRGVAKILRDPTVPEHVDQGALSEFDDGSVSITWRGDGEFLAVNSVLNIDIKRRVIRVFNREGVLESVSEPVDGLEASISWKPSGQLIAGVRRTDKGLEVVFFERNGLRHGEFSLRMNEIECADIGKNAGLSWNVDSTILAVNLADRVQLWTMGNYHYYLKQELITSRNSSTARSSLSWHPEIALRLAAYDRHQAHVLEYAFMINRGSVVQPYDNGLVASIDGKILKLTPMKIANIPPPMALHELEVASTIIDTAFDSERGELAVLHLNELSIWRYDVSMKTRQPPQAIRTVNLKLESESGSSQVLQITTSRDGGYIVLVSSDDGYGYRTIDKDGHVTQYQTLSRSPVTLIPSTTGQLCFQDCKGAVLKIQTGDNSQKMITTLPTPCAHIEMWEDDAGTTIVCGLSSNGTLHISQSSSAEALRISGCTSFIVTEEHLILTTSQHLLKFVHLHGGTLEIPGNEPEVDERCRSVERGARIVTVIPSSHAVILQMPRGNLETIYPRALVLAGIRANIRLRDYRTAFSICRMQRVDMNLLHDYAPEQFVKDIDLFLKQVRKVEYVDLFLSSLSEEDVTKTIYKDTNFQSMNFMKDDAVSGKTVLQISKVNRICDGFLVELEKDSSRLQNIISAHVCKNPPDLSAGLALVSTLRQREEQDVVEKAVEHICFLADVNQLYETALGLYDLDVALLVAQQSQKDPREYLPYLQNLQTLSPLRRQFQIDDDLKRYTKAIKHLHATDEFEELKTYMIRHELYSDGMELYRYDSKRMVELMRLYADHNSKTSRHKEAGIAYEYVKDYASASEAYRAAALWQECLGVAELVPVSSEALRTLATDLAESLEQGKEYASAATIHLEYLDDLSTAARLLCKGCLFGEAIRLATRHKQPQLLVDVIDVGLIEASANMTELLAEMKTQLQNQVPRLRELRQKKADDPMAFLDGGGDADNTDFPDNISLAPTEASTTGTFMTRYTNRSTGTLATNASRKTSKNRRREERRRAKGKKGTVYEEEYLVNSIARLIERLNTTSDEVSRLVQGLMRRAMRERALAVEQAMIEVQQACESSTEEVFDQARKKDPMQNAGQMNGVEGGEGLERPTGGQGVLWDALHGSGHIPAPAIKAFQRLSMLS